MLNKIWATQIFRLGHGFVHDCSLQTVEAHVLCYYSIICFSGGNKSKKKRREINNKNPVFMEGVPGVHPVLDQPRLTKIQTTVQEMCSWNR